MPDDYDNAPTYYMQQRADKSENDIRNYVKTERSLTNKYALVDMYGKSTVKAVLGTIALIIIFLLISTLVDRQNQIVDTIFNIFEFFLAVVVFFIVLLIANPFMITGWIFFIAMSIGTALNFKPEKDICLFMEMNLSSEKQFILHFFPKWESLGKMYIGYENDDDTWLAKLMKFLWGPLKIPVADESIMVSNPLRAEVKDHADIMDDVSSSVPLFIIKRVPGDNRPFLSIVDDPMTLEMDENGMPIEGSGKKVAFFSPADFMNLSQIQLFEEWPDVAHMNSELYHLQQEIARLERKVAIGPGPEAVKIHAALWPDYGIRTIQMAKLFSKRQEAKLDAIITQTSSGMSKEQEALAERTDLLKQLIGASQQQPQQHED